jgi:octanoyl-[GcvH]:protein N-octanoyltransferase
MTAARRASGAVSHVARDGWWRLAAKLRLMPSVDVELLEGPAGADPALEVALPQALLAMVAAGRRGPVLRCYRPPPTVAFGRRDGFLPGFARAAVAAKRRGFAPVIRGAGGRAAAYDEGCLVFDEIVPATESMRGIRARFADEAGRQAQALRSLGVDARVGEVPGEYCPGEFSVNARGRTKLIGAAQRIVRGAWLFSTVVVVWPADGLRAVLEDVYAELGLEWDPATTGSVSDEVSDVSIEAVQRALLRIYTQRYRLMPASLGVQELAGARELLGRHGVNV